MKKNLPERPSLEWLRRQSKDLLKQMCAARPDALLRLQAHHPDFGDGSPSMGDGTNLALHHAQLVLAREHGFRSWARMKQEVEFRASMSLGPASSDGRHHVLCVRDGILDVLESAASDASVRTVVERLGERFAELHTRRDEACPIVLRNHDPEFVDKSREEMFRHEFSRENWMNLASRYFRFDGWESVDKLGDRQLDSGFESAVDAMVAGNVDGLHGLLRDRPGLISARSAWGHEATLLHYVAANGVEIHRQVVPLNALEVATLLLDAGADADALCKTYGGGPADTTLCLLISSGHPGDMGVKESLVELLLDRGARVDGVDGRGDPLRTAVMFGLPQISELLLQHGANPPDLNTAAGASVVPAVERFLSDHAKQSEIGEALYLSSRNGHLEVVRRLLGSGADVNQPGLFGASPLLWAAYEGRFEIVKLLVEHGADPNRRDTRFDASAAGWANESGNSKIRDWLLENGCQASIVEAAAFGRIDLVERHLSEGRDRVHVNEGRTALHEAAGRGFRQISELLLKNGADVRAVDCDGLTPIDWARRHHRDDLLAMLEAVGD